jgi:hypothetical protein
MTKINLNRCLSYEKRWDTSEHSFVLDLRKTALARCEAAASTHGTARQSNNANVCFA